MINRRGFLKTLGFAAPIVFVPKLITINWKFLGPAIYFPDDRFNLLGRSNIELIMPIQMGRNWQYSRIMEYLARVAPTSLGKTTLNKGDLLPGRGQRLRSFPNLNFQ